MRSIQELEAISQGAERVSPQGPRLAIVPDPKSRAAVLTIALPEQFLMAVVDLPVADVKEAATMREALELLRTSHYEAIFLNGEATVSASELDHLRSAAPRTPKVLLGQSPDTSHLDAFPWSSEFSFLQVGAQFESEVHSLLYPRGSERISMRLEGRRVLGRIGDRSFDHPVIDISNLGLSFEIRQGDRLDGFVPGTAVTGLQIIDASRRVLLGPVDATLRHGKTERSPNGPCVVVGLSFDAPVRAQAPHYKVLRDAVPITAAIRKASRAGSSFTVIPPDEETGFRFESAEVELGSPMTLVLNGAVPAELKPQDAVRLSFSHYGQSYSGLTTVVSTGQGVGLAMPRSLRVHHRRGSNRHRPARGRAYHAQLTSPLTGTHESFPIDDINATGLSIIVDLNTQLFPPGLILDPIQITPPDGGEPILAHGVVRSLTPRARSADNHDSRPARCGIELLRLSHAEQNRLSHNLLIDGFPHVEAGKPEDFEAIWGFLQEAGFVAHLYHAADPEKMQAVKEGYAKMLGAAHPLAAHLVYREEGKIRGHFTALRLYSNTVLATHLAALQGKAAGADRISRALCMGGSEYTEQQAPIEWVKLIWNRDLSWPNKMFGWTGRSIYRPGLSEARDFGILVRPNTLPLPAPIDGVHLGNPTEAELLRIERWFLENSGLVRIQSEDLTHAGLRMGVLSDEYRRCGLRRERNVRVARIDGAMCAFSLLERSTQAIQLSEVTNGFDVYEMHEAPADLRKRARAALVGDAVEFYTREGMFYSLALADNPDYTPFLEAGFKVAVAAKSWTLHQTQMRNWIDVWDHMFQNGRTLFGVRPG